MSTPGPAGRYHFLRRVLSRAATVRAGFRPIHPRNVRIHPATVHWHFDCLFHRMLAILLTTLGVCAVALLAEWLACASAPVGYQDDDGFHFGTKPELKDDWDGNPS